MVIWNAKSDTTLILATYATIGILLLISIAGSMSSFGQADMLKANKVKLGILEEDIRRLDTALSDTQKYRTSLNQISSTLPGGYEETAKFISQVETRARENSITITESELETSTDKGFQGVQVLKISQKVTGTYQSLTNYISAISNLPFHTSVDQIEITTTGGIPSTNVVIRAYMKTL